MLNKLKFSKISLLMVALMGNIGLYGADEGLSQLVHAAGTISDVDSKGDAEAGVGTVATCPEKERLYTCRSCDLRRDIIKACKDKDCEYMECIDGKWMRKKITSVEDSKRKRESFILDDDASDAPDVTVCPVPGCDSKFTGKCQDGNYTKHYERMHQDGVSVKRCNCGQYFTKTLGDLRRHMSSSRHKACFNGCLKYTEEINGEEVEREFTAFTQERSKRRTEGPAN